MLTGIQIGPRQFEFPPNMPLSESPGRYDYPKLLIADPIGVGVILVNAREGANSERAQEFIFIEHDMEYPAEIGFIQNRAQDRSLCPAFVGHG
jgi:hypothetical protein